MLWLKWYFLFSFSLLLFASSEHFLKPAIFHEQEEQNQEWLLSLRKMSRGEKNCISLKMHKEILRKSLKKSCIIIDTTLIQSFK